MKDVRDYYKYAIRPDLTTIVVIGDVTPQRAAEVIGKYFGSWKATGLAPATDYPAVPNNSAGVIAVPDSARVQDMVQLAEITSLTPRAPDYYAFLVANSLLGGGFYTSRLSVALRKDTGLVYSVGSGLQLGQNRSAFVVSYASDPDNVVKAAGIVHTELKRMQNQPVPADDLMRAKALLIHGISIGEASIPAIASGFIFRTVYGLPMDEPVVAAKHYLNLSPKDVQAAFRKWVRPADFVRVSQGPVPK